MTSSYGSRIRGVATSVAIKVPARVATTANITISAPQTIDDIAVVIGDRVLVKDQSDGTENGVWVVAASTWSRADDFNGARDVVKGTQVYVQEGTTSADYIFTLSTLDPIIGTSSLSFTTPNVAGSPVSSAMEPVVAASSLTSAKALLFAAGYILVDGVKAQFGNGAEAEIYRDASQFYITNQVGDIVVTTPAGDVLRLKSSTGAHLAKFFPGSGVELYFNNSERIKTTNEGITVTGKINGKTLETAVATTSGTAKDFPDIPANINKIEVLFRNVSPDSIADLRIQIGDSGGIETASYSSAVQSGATVESSTAAFVVADNVSASDGANGIITLERVVDNAWVSSGVLSGDTSIVWSSAGRKSLSGSLDRVRVLWSPTTDFDLGYVNIRYEE